MGNTGVADMSDPSNGFLTPAAILGAPAIYATTSYGDLYPGGGRENPLRTVSGGGVFNAGPVKLGVEIAWSELDLGEGRIIFLPWGVSPSSHGDRYTGLRTAIGFGFGDRYELALGTMLKEVEVNYGTDPVYGEVTSSALAVDLGLIAAAAFDAGDWRIAPALALSAVNMGETLTLEPVGFEYGLPEQIHYGISVRIDSESIPVGSASVPLFSAVANVDANAHQYDDKHTIGIGTEASLLKVVYFRFGSVIDKQSDTSNSAWGAGLGIPAGSFYARLDYGSEGLQLYNGRTSLNRYSIYMAWWL
jgi:hypothetical protein